MKKSLVTTIAILSIAMLFSFKTIYDLKKSTAEVSTTEKGYYVFLRSEPISKYKIIDTLYPYNVDFDNLNKKIEKELAKNHPKCDGLIIKNFRSTVVFYPIMFE